MASTNKSEQHLRWLRDELPKLVASEVLDEGAVARLRQHYGLGAISDPRSIAWLVFGALGALLIGGGVILIIAHNWEDLSRAVRAAMSLGLLALAQSLCAYVLLRRRASAAWSEASALWLCLSLGAAIAIISQTYNLGGELGDFMTTWTALCLPVVYLMDARLSAALFLTLLLPLPSATMSSLSGGLAYLLLLALLLPYVASATTRYPQEGRTRLVHLLAALTIPLGVGLVLGARSSGRAEDALLPMLAALYACLHLLGSRVVERSSSQVPSFSTPLTSVGLLGLVGLSVAMTFDYVFPWTSSDNFSQALSHPELRASLAIAVALSALPLYMAARDFARHRLDEALLHGLPVMALSMPVLLGLTENPLLIIALGNIYLLAISVALLATGLGARDLRRTNVGLCALSLLFVIRFVDSDLSFVVRGLAMVVVGICLISVNVWLLRQAKSTRVEAP